MAQLHLALVMAIDAKLLVLDEPTLGLDILYRKQFYDSLLNDYFDRQPHHRRDDASGGRDPGRPDRSHVHQSRPHRPRVQHGRIRFALSGSDGAIPSISPRRGRSSRFTSARCSVAAFCCSTNADREQLAALGEVRRPSIADLFVAVMGEHSRRSIRSRTGNRGKPNDMRNRIHDRYLAIESQGPARLRRSPTRPFYWSVRRELWENRSIYLAPLIVAGVVLFGFVISAFGLPRRRRDALLLDPAQQRAAIEKPYDVAAMMIMFTAFIVGVFYCLDALHGERRDRSILFWKSLPVSDLTTVLSKAIIPLVVLPLLTFAIIVATQLIMLLDEHGRPAAERSGAARPGNSCPISALVDSALRSRHRGALAGAALRLAAARLRLGAARDISLGGVAVARDLLRREDRVQHDTFRRPTREPANGKL